MQEIKRKGYMRIDINNNFELGRSLNPPSFKERNPMRDQHLTDFFDSANYIITSPK